MYCAQLVVLFQSYFEEFSEAAIKNNFVLIYELLDEVRLRRPSGAWHMYCSLQHSHKSLRSGTKYWT